MRIKDIKKEGSIELLLLFVSSFFSDEFETEIQ